MTFLLPNLTSQIMKSTLIEPIVIISSVSYSMFIIILWSYIEYLKECECTCSNINKHKYVLTFAWFLIILYVIWVSYLGTMISRKVFKW